MAGRRQYSDLDFGGQGTVQGLRPPQDPGDAVSQAFVVERINDLPLDTSDPGDTFILALEGGML